MSKGVTLKLVEQLIEDGGKSDPSTISYIRTKLMLKGIDPDRYTDTDEDDEETVAILKKFIRLFLGVDAVVEEV